MNDRSYNTNWKSYRKRLYLGTTQDIEQYLSAKEKLKQIDPKDLEAIKIPAKAQFMEDGERSTRYFYSLKKMQESGPKTSYSEKGKPGHYL